MERTSHPRIEDAASASISTAHASLRSAFSDVCAAEKAHKPSEYYRMQRTAIQLAMQIIGTAAMTTPREVPGWRGREAEWLEKTADRLRDAETKKAKADGH